MYKRECGAGPYRIGKNIKLRDDLYSMLFATSIRAEYVFHYWKKKTLKEDAINDIVE